MKDRAGHFTQHSLTGGAKLHGSRLVLDGTGRLIAERAEPCVAETPQWPDKPPANWLTFHLAHPGPGVAWAIVKRAAKGPRRIG